MKLILFTPTSKTSAIGGCSLFLSKALIARGHDVTIVQTEAKNLQGNALHEFTAPIIPWQDFDAFIKASPDIDAAIYQIGNHYPFHYGAIEWLPKLPGLVCLHDFFLGNLFSSWAVDHHDAAVRILQNWYGENVAKRFFTFQSADTFIEGTKDTSPMTEWICSQALGVLTHSSWGAERVLQSCPGPVRSVPLNYHKTINTPLPKASKTPSQLNILTIGQVNRNKRAESVIQAISASPLLREHAVYRLAGSIPLETAERLSLQAKAGGVTLIISGEVDDPTMEQAVRESDVICCLRWPPIEAASASTIEALLSGRPALVTNTGFYAELPDDLVLKINPDNELPELRRALELLYRDPAYRERIGAAGHNWAATTFTSENYATNLTELVSAIWSSKPAIDATGYFTNIMNAWAERFQIENDPHIINPLSLFEQ